MKKTYIFLVLFCFIIFVRVFIMNINFSNNYVEEEKQIAGKITYISKKDKKTTFDVKGNNNYRIITYKKFDYELGDELTISGLFYTPKSNTVFNLFNYKKYLLSKKIFFICSDCKINLISKNKNILYKIKNNMIKHIDKYESKAYLLAFILGDTGQIEENVLDGYRQIGISHLFSISGMHVNIFVMFLSCFFRKFKKKDIIIILFLLFFLFLTNFSRSLLRCILFYILKIISKECKLEIINVLLLIITACILLFFNPYLIYDIGFLFSFIITFYILLFGKYLDKKSYFKKIFFLSSISFLASIPLLAYNFFKINFLSIIYNLIFVPFISFVVFPLGIITFIFPFLDNIYLSIIHLLESLSNTLSNINFLSFAISKPNIIVLFLYYLVLYLTLKKDFKIIILFLLLLFININSRFMIVSPKITYLDVGQGDSNILIMPKGKTIVIDTGGNIMSRDYISKNTIIPYLNSNGISQIEVLVLTHGDFDHMGEAINLVNNFKVEKVVFNCGEFNELEQDLIKVLDRKEIPYYSCIKELNIDDNKLYFLNNNDYGNENDNSNVIYTELNNHKFLFMGDAGVGVEEDLIDKYNLKDIDVLKVGHHGSRTSSSKEFIDEINPRYSIISVGKNNRYGHPNDNVLDNLEDSKIYRTDQDGSIMFKIKNNKLEVETCTP